MFRLIVKRLKPQDKQKNYDWLETSLFSRWTDKGNLLICFDTPEDFPQRFEATLQAHQGDAGENFHKPYALHVILMDFLIPIYDRSVWDMSRKVREIEEVPTFRDSDSFLKKLTAIMQSTANPSQT